MLYEKRIKRLKLNSLSNRDLMPGICLNLTKSNLELSFNDISKTSIASLFYKNSFNFKLFSFEFDGCNTNNGKDLFKIKLNKIEYKKDLVNLSQNIQLVSLKMEVNYILEVIYLILFEQKSKYIL